MMEFVEIFLSVVFGMFLDFVDLFRFHESEEYDDSYKRDVDRYFR